jgi:hypothetical protein
MKETVQLAAEIEALKLLNREYQKQIVQKDEEISRLKGGDTTAKSAATWSNTESVPPAEAAEGAEPAAVEPAEPEEPKRRARH